MATPTAARADLGDALANLSAGQQQAFRDGKAQFEEVQTPSTGLGPVFNEDACVVCHASPTGGNGFEGHASPRFETRFGRIVNGAFDPLANRDGSLLHNQGIGSVRAFVPPLSTQCLPPFEFLGEEVPAEATMSALRRSNPLFGLGLVDATPDSTFIRLAAIQADETPTTAGSLGLVINPDSGQIAVGRIRSSTMTAVTCSASPTS
jgi:CxxC motif-containing protein (DUF1111 family)